jgi:hypothetical protein
MNINDEGQKKIDELRLEHVITDNELLLYREQCLLRKLHECEDELEQLLDGGKDDPHYTMFKTLIDRLEHHLQNKSDLM